MLKVWCSWSSKIRCLVLFTWKNKSKSWDPVALETLTWKDKRAKWHNPSKPISIRLQFNAQPTEAYLLVSCQGQVLSLNLSLLIYKQEKCIPNSHSILRINEMYVKCLAHNESPANGGSLFQRCCLPSIVLKEQERKKKKKKEGSWETLKLETF